MDLVSFGHWMMLFVAATVVLEKFKGHDANDIRISFLVLF